MDYDNWKEQQSPVYDSPKKPRRWPWAVLAVVLVLGLSAAMHVMNFPAVHVEKLENGFAVRLGDSARGQKEEQTSQMSEQAPPMQAMTGTVLGTEQKLAVAPTRPGVEQVVVEGGMSLQEIYETVLPSVVTITTQTYGGSGLGTGVIMSADGYVITNQHVIENAVSVQVTLSDDTAYAAALVGGDVASDLAVLKIEAQNLTPAQFGDSESLRVGDQVVAIGNPLGTGLRGTMTDGIISGISRDLMVSGRKMTLIQTNAALNNGNSGGPLINCYGQVVGINAVKLTDNYYNTGVEGLGFAIPISIVKPIVDDLIAKGYVTGRPAIGVVVEELPLRARIYFTLPEGAYVTQVDPRSDAAAQGLRSGDIITALGGQAVSGPASLSALKDAYKAGDTVIITVYRDGSYADVSVVLMDQVTDES